MVKYLSNIYLVIFVSCFHPIKAQKNQAPNIIFILADDLGFGDIQALNPESNIPTPSINLLAKQGISFTNAHSTSSVCTPSRYSFLTGRYSWRSDLKKGVIWMWDPPLIEENRFTIGEMLHKQGYSTACIGKWHLGWEWPTKDGHSIKKNEGRNVDYDKPIMNGPITRGFDYYFGQDIPSLAPHVLIENDKVITQPSAWLTSPAGWPGAMEPGWQYEDLMNKITSKAIEYVKVQTVKNTNKPFFLYFSLSAPHTPIAPHGNFLHKTEVGRYGDFVYEMDHHVGRLLKTVDSLNIQENTLIIFTSDNGGINADGHNYTGKIGSLLKFGHNSNGEFRGIKSDAWEGGHRIPFIARWPGHIIPNSSSDIVISQVDMMATFAAITGAELPPGVAEDSYNILPALIKPSHSNIREALVTQSGNGILAIQKEQWKLILSSGGGGKWTLPVGELPKLVPATKEFVWQNVQLFNLNIDFQENNNIATLHPNKILELMDLLKDYIINGKSNPARSAVQQNSTNLWPEVKWVEQY
ncbi:arylsulfatase [soil metagenome]